MGNRKNGRIIVSGDYVFFMILVSLNYKQRNFLFCYQRGILNFFCLGMHELIIERIMIIDIHTC